MAETISKFTGRTTLALDAPKSALSTHPNRVQPSRGVRERDCRRERGRWPTHATYAVIEKE